MDDLSGPEKFDDIVYIRIIGEAQDIIIGDSSLLLCRQIFCKVGDQVALHRHAGGAPGEARRSSGINTGSPVYKIGVKARSADLFLSQISGELVYNRTNHLQVP